MLPVVYIMTILSSTNLIEMAVLVLQNKNIHCTVDFGFYFYFFLFAIDSMPLLIDNDFNQSLIKK